MKLGILAGYSGRKFSISIDAIKHAENLGYESIWTAEAYGSDAVTPAAWIWPRPTASRKVRRLCRCRPDRRRWRL